MIKQFKNFLGSSVQKSTENSCKADLHKTSSLGGLNIKSLSKRFAKNESGNIAMMFGLSSVMLVGSTFMAVDYSRFVQIRGDMIEAMDAAGLAMAQYSELNPDIGNSELIDYGSLIFRENFDNIDKVDNLQISFNITPADIQPVVEATLEGLILKDDFRVGNSVFEFDHFDLGSATTITRQGRGRIEMALVLDVTGSMNSRVGNSPTTKLQDMKNSVEGLLDTLYGDAQSSDNVRVGIVPFNAHVNVGDANSSFSTNWLDTNADSFYHGARFIHADFPNLSNQDTSFNARRENSNNSSGGTFGYNNSTGIPRIMDVDRKVNHFHLFNSNSDFTWAGCVEARPYPLDELDVAPGLTTSSGVLLNEISGPPAGVTPDGSVSGRVDNAFNQAPQLSVSADIVGGSNNTRWVPQFIPDGPDCSSNSGCHQIGGSDNRGRSTQNVYGYSHGTYYEEAFYDRPSTNGHDNSDYSDGSYIIDRSFIQDSGSGNDARNFRVYNDFILGFRHALGNGGNESTYWRDIEDRFDELGADNFFRDEYIARTAYVGLFNPATNTYSYRYDNSVNENLNSSLRNPNQSCPDPILPLTENRDEISETVDNLTADGFTNSAFGAVWGWRLLSPEAPFTEGVSYDDGQYQKVAVIMTDGENVIGTRDTHWGSVSTSYGFASEERMGSGINTANEMRDEIDNKMLRICQRMKDEGILVYTIIFGLDSSRAEQLYRACATEPNAPFFHDAANGVDLEEAFGDIAADLVRLHISQ